MIILFAITAFIILLYLVYPVWLSCIASRRSMRDQETELIDSVSLILLSYNGRQYLDEKINFLLGELSGFTAYELIIIDDCSTDGSNDVLQKYRERPNIRLFFNAEHRGIPYSMNRGVGSAAYDYVIFCDQRQLLSGNILKRIVEPLKLKKVGAVSGCISCLDKARKSSYLRKHENFVKVRESRTGSLIGVYGPFYAIKKQCYCRIPENIILDDLYLSLRILKSKQIELLEDCEIIDENFTVLYDYKRTRRYLSGLIQILQEKSIIHDLNYRQRTMLIWHKYLRLVIPSLLFLCYLGLGVSMGNGLVYGIAFSMGTVAVLFSVLPVKSGFPFRLRTLVRMNVLYLMAFADIMINDVLLSRPNNTNQGQL